MNKAIDISGMKFGALTAIRSDRIGGRPVWFCACDCGSSTMARASDLRRGSVSSCGCIHSENVRNRNAKHGMCGTRTYAIWSGMVQRCTNPRNERFEAYGSRGIQVCDRWMNFDGFLSDMGIAPDGMSIERIDNDLGYSPENCKWATRHDQARNTRRNRLLTHSGITLCVEDWAARVGIPSARIRGRLYKGWPIDRALSTNDFRSFKQPLNDAGEFVEAE